MILSIHLNKQLIGESNLYWKHGRIHYNEKTITLTNKECDVLDDMFMYMVDYMEDRCWSGADKRAFDRIYRKLGKS